MKDITVQSEKTEKRVEIARDDRVNAVLNWLRPLAEPVAAEAEFARWISARYADTEQSESWCTPCAKAEVERLNSLHPEHEYLVDGGWGSETDNPRYCCKCGKTLSDYLTSYAIRDEVDHYSRHAVSLRGKSVAERAFRFTEVFESASFDMKDSDAWRFFRKVERMCERRRGNAAMNQIPHANPQSRKAEGDDGRVAREGEDRMNESMDTLVALAERRIAGVLEGLETTTGMSASVRIGMVDGNDPREREGKGRRCVNIILTRERMPPWVRETP